MSGPAVTVVASGGLPIQSVGSGAPPLQAVTSGGVAVTLADSGPAFVLGGTIGGLVVGSAGTGIYDGYTLAGGDEFTTLDLIQPSRPRGKYGTTRAYLVPSTTTQAPRGSSGLAGYDWDPKHTGDNDANRGRSVASLQDIITQSGSSLILKARKATTDEQALFHDTSKPVASSMIHGGGAFLVRSPCIVECRMKIPLGTGTPHGTHYDFWVQMANPISQSLTEIDLNWESANGGTQLNQNANVWASGSPTGTNGTAIDNDTAFHTYTFVITDTQVDWYLDGANKRSATLAIGTYDRPYFMLITNHCQQAEYTDADWTAAGNAGETLEVDWVRYWNTGANYKPLVGQADINVDFGGAASVVLPDAATVWGDSSVTEIVEAWMTDANEPGGSYNGGYANLPVGITWASGTLAVANTITQPGRVQMVRHAWSSGSSCVPQRFAVNVGPTITSADQVVANGGAVSWDVYAECNSGDLINVDAANPKGIVITGLPAGVSFDPATGLVTGTPTDDDTLSYLTVSCTNVAGQTATRQVSMVVGSPTFSAEAQTYFDAMATKPTTLQMAELDRAISALVANGVWAKLLQVSFLAGHDATAVLKNAKTPGTLDLALVSTPSFTAGQGYLGNGSSQALDCGYTPDAARQNDFAFGIWSLTSTGGGSADMGNTNSLISARNNSNVVSSRVNSGTSGTGTSTDGSGFYVASRQGPNAADDILYRNGSVVARTSQAVSAAPSGAMRVLGTGGTARWSTKRIAFSFISTGLSAADEENLRLPVVRWLKDVGAIS